MALNHKFYTEDHNKLLYIGIFTVDKFEEINQFAFDGAIVTVFPSLMSLSDCPITY